MNKHKGKKNKAKKATSQSKQNPAESKPKEYRTCLVCERRFIGKTKLCQTCNKRRKFTSRNGEPKVMSIGAVLEVKRRFPSQNPFDLIWKDMRYYYSALSGTTHAERNTIRRVTGEYYRSSEYVSTNYTKNSDIPPYIQAYFRRNPQKELRYIEGNKDNPLVYYVCKRCGKEQCQRFSDLANGTGHGCDAVKSSGEAVVEDFLNRNRIPHFTQHDTLRCVNPKTGFALPYDFEIRNRKIIIEVQGNQHFAFIPYFHGTEDNFRYCVWKDNYKRDFAERMGYKVLYIDYNDISSGRYTNMIMSACKYPVHSV